jgi:hypothetical protein
MDLNTIEKEEYLIILTGETLAIPRCWRFDPSEEDHFMINVGKTFHTSKYCLKPTPVFNSREVKINGRISGIIYAL